MVWTGLDIAFTQKFLSQLCAGQLSGTQASGEAPESFPETFILNIIASGVASIELGLIWHGSITDVGFVSCSAM